MGLILNIVILVFAILMACIPLRFDILNRDQVGKIKNVTRPGKWFFCFAILSLAAGIWKIFSDDHDVADFKDRILILDSKVDSQARSYKHLTDQNDSLKTYIGTLESSLDKLGEEGKKNTDAILAHQPRINTFSNLKLCNMVYGHRQNPYVRILTDTLIYDFSICNNGTAIASEIVDQMVVIRYLLAGPPVLIPHNYSVANASLEISPSDPTGTIIPEVMYYGGALKDIGTTFVYLKVSYSDKGTKERKYLHEILQKYPDENLRPIFGFDYDSLKNLLVANKLW